MKRYGALDIALRCKVGRNKCSLSAYVGREFLFGNYDCIELEDFSDIDSRIEHLKRIGNMLSAVGMVNLVIGLVNSFNLINVGWINLLCATLLMYALGRIHGKKEALEKARILHE